MPWNDRFEPGSAASGAGRKPASGGFEGPIDRDLCARHIAVRVKSITRSSLGRIVSVAHGNRALLAEFGARGHVAARLALALATAIVLTSSGHAITAAKATPAEAPPSPLTWSVNLYNSSVVRFQNPDPNACVAAATVSMLGIIALNAISDTAPPVGSSLPTTTFRWGIDTTYATQESVMDFDRKHMTMYRGYKGSDPHGWRNALNYFGWGSMYAGVYKDASYPNFAAAAQATVDSLARTNKPVGILGWWGGHAQYITGYVVQGRDPRVSDKYTIVGVYLSDPLRETSMPNVFITLSQWKNGPVGIEFTRYQQSGSVFPDPIDGQAGDIEWHNKWVIIEPVK
jgi:hypothetical protein